MNSIAYSPDGKKICAGSENGDIAIWGVEYDKEPATWNVTRFQAHAGRVHGLHFARSGTALVSASNDGVIKSWHPNTAALWPRLVADARDFATMAVSPDGRWVAAGDRSGTVVLWDAISGEVSWRTLVHKSTVTSISFDAPARQILTSGDDGYLALLDPETGTFTSWPAHSSWCRGAQIASDGRTAFSIGYDRRVRAWSTTTKTLIWESPTDGWVGTALTVSPSGDRVACGTMGGGIILYDAIAGMVIFELGPPPGKLYETEASIWHLRYSPDGAALAVISNDSTIRIMDTATGKPVQELRSPNANPIEADFSPCGKRFASLHTDGSVRIWDTQRYRCVAVLREPVEQENGSHGIAYSADGSRLLVVKSDSIGLLESQLDQLLLLWDRSK